MKLTLILILILVCITVFGLQGQHLDPKIEEIESLIYFSQYEKAMELVDSNLQSGFKPINNRANKQYRLKLLTLKSEILLRQEFETTALSILLEALTEAVRGNFYSIAARLNLQLAVVYEKNKNFIRCNQSLNDAFTLCESYGLDSLLSRYYIRKSSYYRKTDRVDSALIFAKEGYQYALAFKNADDIKDSYLLLGLLYADKDFKKSEKYFKLVIEEYRKRNEKHSISLMYHNLAKLYISQNKLSEARSFNDSAFVLLNDFAELTDTMSVSYIQPLLQQKALILERMGELDSVIYYQKLYFDKSMQIFNARREAELFKIAEDYEDEKNKSIIKSRTLWLSLLAVLTIVIAALALILFFQNNKINAQNQIIQNQVEELQKSLDQKQILLSELQHRVKNNLQYVISILEIQRESIDIHNIDELIRENKNRIQSMALLHHRLSLKDSINEVDIGVYLHELSLLVKDSYSSVNNKVNIVTHSALETVDLATALPLGLILVELMSNSIKHAFEHKIEGEIEFSIGTDDKSNKRVLKYADNGSGFDFHNTESKGLGMEIIKGLIDQLNGKVTVQKGEGFEIAILF